MLIIAHASTARRGPFTIVARELALKVAATPSDVNSVAETLSAMQTAPQAVVLEWDEVKVPLVIDAIRRSRRHSEVSIVVVGLRPVDALLRAAGGAIALFTSRTTYLELEATGEGAEARLAERIIMRASDSSPFDRSQTLRLLDTRSLDELRGIRNEHEARDLVGPAHWIAAASEAFDSQTCQRALATLRRESDARRATSDGLSFDERRRLAHITAVLDGCVLSTHGPRAPFAERWLLVEDNRSWAVALRCILETVELVPIPRVEEDAVIERLVSDCAQRTLSGTVDGIIVALTVGLDVPPPMQTDDDIGKLPGILFVEQFRGVDPATPIVVLSGSSSSSIGQRLAQMRCQHWVKPAAREEATATIAGLLALRTRAENRTPTFGRRRAMMVLLRTIERRGLRPLGGVLLPHSLIVRRGLECLTLWSMAVHGDSRDPTTQALRRAAMMALGLSAEHVLEWMLDSGWLHAGATRKYVLAPLRADADVGRVFDLLYGSRASLYKYRNRAAHEDTAPSDYDLDAAAETFAEAFGPLVNGG